MEARNLSLPSPQADDNKKNKKDKRKGKGKKGGNAVDNNKGEFEEEDWEKEIEADPSLLDNIP